ncbi:hypothetical protein ACU6QH_00645, partial [Aeromonas veronii]|uniref:hypothetical protein n=1 Tax=Aeromonas veronii TaxID=654 RepID=UPI00406CEFFA
VQRKPKPYKPTGFAPLDQVRDKCFELKLTMPDLDAMCRTKNYFSKNGWRGWKKVISYRKLGRAIRVLDGEVQIDWND